MGVSTNGQICFGVMFDEGFDFPWDNFSEEDWWLKVIGYKPPFELYTEDGNYIDEKAPTKEKIAEYHHHRAEFEKRNPLPFKVVNYCSGECPMYILATPSSVLEANRGYPEDFDPATLNVDESERVELLRFIEKFMPHAASPAAKWYLSSYWG